MHTEKEMIAMIKESYNLDPRPEFVNGTSEFLKERARGFTANREISKKRSIKKSALLYSSAAMVAFSMFVGSAFYFPTVAKMATYIPYFGVVFDSRGIGDILWDEFLDNDFQVNSIGKRTSERTIDVYIGGTEDFFSKTKDDVIRTGNRILSMKGYDSYSLKVVHDTRNPAHVDTKEQKEKRNLANDVKDMLKDKGYLVWSTFITTEEDSNLLRIVIPTTEHRENEINSAVHSYLRNKDESDFKIIVDQTTFNADSFDSRIDEILSVNKEIKYSGLGYSEKSGKLVLFVKTSINSTDPSAPEVAKNIKRTVKEILSSKEIGPYISKPFDEIIVRSKDGETIN
ncbi:hypothetical protein [Fictibacillus sp. BK138]|uniref:hypothetical protein n=1 Tax=Fictibacillus sp. BK138 TaxID=2512121 RepID=UPI0010D6B904|nr:hypothetical protein [Fictibacillus sp. BK138]RZT15521.1 uncharacterized protein DUF4030 [Fictibacillus sp. BK138]